MTKFYKQMYISYVRESWGATYLKVKWIEDFSNKNQRAVYKFNGIFVIGMCDW